MEFTQEVQKATDPIYQKISKVMPEIEWSVHAPYIHKINELKKKKNAVILPNDSFFSKSNGRDSKEAYKFSTSFIRSISL